MDAVLDELAQDNNSAAAASFRNAVPVPDSLTHSLTGKVSKSEAVGQYKDLLQKRYLIQCTVDPWMWDIHLL